ncbi:efflux RND transporter permease subunit [Paraglaciecola hydrolytica]|uniref:Acriflavine resistance protein B n=1 Tax=Paraglaciecola hydrolytica TaxID=1799789 RepID=A0A148KLK5_9ALTE|nr:efflux RND transporter permease subunit [Paraglaciecola hydrolytica]KXI27151.1 acriflavine resistance protein B [Paraglaciecola hydrolytica]
MNFTDLFIKRPVVSIVVSILILLAGFQAATSLTVRQYPKSDVSVINIQTVYIGASADLVKGFITSPLERAVASAEGIDYVESSSSLGFSDIKVHLKLNFDPIRAMSEINAKVNAVRGELPPEAEVPALSIISADSEFAAAYLSFTSDILTQNQITDYLRRSIQPRLAAIDGVQKAETLGGRVFAMRIWLKPQAMEAMNVTPSELRQALAANNVQATLGQTRGMLTQVNLSADTDLNSVEDFQQLIIRRTAQGTVRLADVADVELGAEDYNTVVSYSGQTAVFMGVWVMPTANALDVMKAVREDMAAIREKLPTGLDAMVSYDSTEYIESAIEEVIKTLSETLLIIIIVIFLFLGFSRSVLIPVFAIPLSLIGALFLMQMFGFTLNLLTLLAIVLSVGLVVDDAIVMVENIERHIEEGQSPIQAALIGARELAGPIIAMTVTLVSVYVPIGFQGGLTGTLFREFAITLAGAVSISAIVALTLSPMLGSRWLKTHKKVQAPLGPIFDRFQKFYTRSLTGSLQNRPAVYLFWVVIAFLAVLMYIMSPTELAPNEDQGVIFGITEAPANSTIDQSVFYVNQANDVYQSIEETDFTFLLTFPSGGFSGMVVKPWEQRERSVFEILPEVQEKLAGISGVRIFPVTPPALPGGGSFPFEFVLTSQADPEQIYEISQVLVSKAMESGMFAFPPMIDLKIDQPNARLKVSREKVAELGLDMQTVTRDLAVLLGGNYVNRFNMEGYSYKVIPQVKRSARLNPSDIEDLYVTGLGGNMIRVADIAEIEIDTVPRSLNRTQQMNSVKISGQPTTSLDEALSYMEDEARKIMPQGYGIDYTGQSRQLRLEGNSFLPAFLMAITMIFLVLAAQFNSFRDPLVILGGSVPLALFGAMVFTFLKIPAPMPYWTDGWTTTLNIYSQVGLVTLVGLIARNGILVVEFANKLQEQGKSKLEAVQQASIIRLRPVMMTSIATIAGHTPLIFADGAGAGARNAIGLVLVCGMAIGTIFTLYVLPSVYMLLAKDHSKAEHLQSEYQN